MTIHRVLNPSVHELNRVLELIQKQAIAEATGVVDRSKPTGGSGASSATTGTPGPPGPAGPAGADGVMNLDLLVVAQNEEEIVIVDDAGDVVYDEMGLAVMERHVGWALVTDNQGNIITAE